jgi:cation diffusion facilitator family transporter
VAARTTDSARTGESPAERNEERVRLRAALLSLVIGTILLGAKVIAYLLTGSSAVLSDALESIVNVVAAGFAIGGVLFAGRPADRSHPYGHGKIEFFSAAFEGGLITFAAVLIIYESVRAVLKGVEIREIERGLMLVLGSGGINALLGLYLMRTGRRYQSLTLVADGKHVLSDFWTSLGVVIGLLLVRLTGIVWLDPVVAALVGLNLARTGWGLVRQAAGGLLDEEDPELVRRLVAALQERSTPGIIRIHNLRAIRSGRFHHVDAHLVVPAFWSVDQAHEAQDAFEKRVMAGLEGEIVFHTDPCRQYYCAQCDLDACPLRARTFAGRPILTVDEAIMPDQELLVLMEEAARERAVTPGPSPRPGSPA